MNTVAGFYVTEYRGVFSTLSRHLILLLQTNELHVVDRQVDGQGHNGAI
jgi:hypothetical protein